MKNDTTQNNQGTELELIIQEYYQSIMSYCDPEKGYQKVDVQHNVILTGKRGASHQIDVYWEFSLANINYKTIVEVKNWKNRVKEKDILAFKSVLDDIPGNPMGVFVSSGGFQSGAVKYAAHHGIELLTITKDAVRPRIKVMFSQLHTSEIFLIDRMGNKQYGVENAQITFCNGESKSLLKYVEEAEDQEFEGIADGAYDGIIEPEEGSSIIIANEDVYPSNIVKVGFHMIKTTLPICFDFKDFASYIILSVLKNERSSFSPKPKVEIAI